MSIEFEILDHPADMGFRTRAQSLSELFTRSALALTNILVATHDHSDSACSSASDATENVEVNLEGPDLDELMFAWLSEILYQFDGERNIFCGCQSIKVTEADSGFTLVATMLMTKLNPQMHQVKTYVKAITFHQMEIVNTHDNFSAQVYVDI